MEIFIAPSVFGGCQEEITELYKSKDRDFYVLSIFSANNCMLYIYIYICRKLATEKNCAKAGSEFYEKYGIDRKGINIVKIIQNVYGLSLKPTCGVSPLYSMVYPKEVQLCVELYPIKTICVRANFVILEKYRDIAPIISGGFEYKTEYEKKCYVKII